MNRIKCFAVTNAAILCALALAGCSGEESGTQIDSSKPGQVQNVDARIKAVENDPHMPDIAKQSAIAQIKQHQVEAKDNTKRNPAK